MLCDGLCICRGAYPGKPAMLGRDWFGLPGTWLMILFPVLLKWWQPDQFLVSWTVLGVAAGLAALGEGFEFVLGAARSRRTGGSTRGAVLALVGDRWWNHGYSATGAGRGAPLVPASGPLSARCSGTCGPDLRSFKAPWQVGGRHGAVLGHRGQAGYWRGHRGDAGDCRLRVGRA